MAGKTPPTLTEFLEDFPEFSSLNSGMIQRRLDIAISYLDSANWDINFFEAVELFVAHRLALRSMESNSGPTGGISAGIGQVASSSGAGMSTSFSTIDVSSKDISQFWFSKTSYGQDFLRLRQETMPYGAMSS